MGKKKISSSVLADLANGTDAAQYTAEQIRKAGALALAYVKDHVYLSWSQAPYSPKAELELRKDRAHKYIMLWDCYQVDGEWYPSLERIKVNRLVEFFYGTNMDEKPLILSQATDESSRIGFSGTGNSVWAEVSKSPMRYSDLEFDELEKLKSSNGTGELCMSSGFWQFAGTESAWVSASLVHVKKTVNGEKVEYWQQASIPYTDAEHTGSGTYRLLLNKGHRNVFKDPEISAEKLIKDAGLYIPEEIKHLARLSDEELRMWEFKPAE